MTTGFFRYAQRGIAGGLRFFDFLRRREDFFLGGVIEGEGGGEVERPNLGGLFTLEMLREVSGSSVSVSFGFAGWSELTERST